MAAPRQQHTSSHPLDASPLDALRDQGFFVLPPGRDDELTRRVERLLDRLPATGETRMRRSRVYAARNLFRAIPELLELTQYSALGAVAHAVLGAEARPVKALLFSKPRGADWKVPWHQDLTIAVDRRIDLPGFGPWSLKAGVHYVEPPVAVLEASVTLRLHLDRATEDSGALRVIPDSHRLGRIDPDRIDAITATHEEVVCEAERGSVLVMRPLLLHRSLPAGDRGPRRVLQLEYSSARLPPGLGWDADTVGTNDHQTDCGN